MHQSVAFLDVGYLRAEAARMLGSQVAPDAQGCVTFLRTLAEKELCPLLRVYWYDGAFEAGHQRYQSQRPYLDAIASCPGIQLRLGYMRETTPSWQKGVKNALTSCGVSLADFESHFKLLPIWEQKGVDTLIVLDLVRLAQRRVYDTAFLIAGDRDLAEAVRIAQDEGRRVVLLHPAGGGIATELRQLADEVHALDQPTIQTMVRVRS